MDWHPLSGSLSSSLDFFHAKTESTIKEVIKTYSYGPECITSCWMVRFALNHFIIPNRAHGPFPLCHLDFHYKNILFDDEYNISGVLGWSGAQAAPIECLAFSPELVTPLGLSDAACEPTREFRRLVVEALKTKEEVRGSFSIVYADPILSTFCGSDRYDIAHWYVHSNPLYILQMGQQIAKSIYGNHTSWQHLVAVFGGGLPE
jgi:hypothetical protein